MTSSHDSASQYKEEGSILGSDAHHNVSKVRTEGGSGEFVYLGNQKFHRHELMQAFGGSLNVGLTPFPTHKIGNPSPLGLAGFAFTTFVLSMANAQAMGVTIPNVVVGTACFYGGAVQMGAGIFEFLCANTFGATALTSYGAFWLSYAAIQIPSFGIAAAYGDDEKQLSNAVGFFLLGWALFTVMIFLVTLKSTVALSSMFFFLAITFLLLASGEFTGKVGVARAGGVFGVITAFLAWYNAFAGTANSTNSYIRAHPFYLTKQT